MPILRPNTRPTLALTLAICNSKLDERSGTIKFAKSKEKQGLIGRVVLKYSFELLLAADVIELQMSTVRCCLPLRLPQTIIGV
jgi:hypothetical protein